MQRLLTFLATLAIVASACGSTLPVVESAASPDEVAAVEAGTNDADVVAEGEADGDSADGDATDTSSTTTATAAPELLRTGREAILANHTEGKPYVLWYWGSH